jgi:hypothetical protein
MEYFKNHKYINNFLILVIKYLNIYRILLLIRGIIALRARIIRRFFYDYNLLSQWWKIEKVITYI